MCINCEFARGHLDAREFMKNLLEKQLKLPFLIICHGLREFLISSNVGEGDASGVQDFSGGRPGHLKALTRSPQGVRGGGEGAPDGSEVSLFK